MSEDEAIFDTPRPLCPWCKKQANYKIEMVGDKSVEVITCQNTSCEVRPTMHKQVRATELIS